MSTAQMEISWIDDIGRVRCVSMSVFIPQTVMAAGHLGAELKEAGAWSAYAVDRIDP